MLVVFAALTSCASSATLNVWALIPQRYDRYLAAAWCELSFSTISWAWCTDVTLDFKDRTESLAVLPSARVHKTCERTTSATDQ